MEDQAPARLTIATPHADRDFSHFGSGGSLTNSMDFIRFQRSTGIQLTITMEDYDLTLEHQREAALQTMRAADPDNVETILKELFGSGSSQWTGWDEQFVTFVEKNRKDVLVYGSIGDGWHFLLAPAAGEGFWICVRHTMTGKGFLRPQSITALTEVAVEKDFFTPAH